jgi:Domain of unknown function (DUF4440)
MPGEYANLNISKLNEDDLEGLNTVMVAMEEAAAGIHKETDVKNNVKRALEEHGAEKVMQAINDFFEQHLSDQLIFRRADGTVAGKCEFIDELGGGSNKRTAEEVKRLSADGRQDCAMVTLIVVTKEESGSGVEIERRFRNVRYFKKDDHRWIMHFWYNYELTSL